MIKLFLLTKFSQKKHSINSGLPRIIILLHLAITQNKGTDTMKKLLTILSLLTTAVICTACGDRMDDNTDSGSYYENHDYGNGNYDRDDHNNDNTDRNNDRNDTVRDDISDVGDGIRDVVDDVEDAGEDIITDVSSAVSDMMDGDDDTTTTTTE